MLSRLERALYFTCDSFANVLLAKQDCYLGVLVKPILLLPSARVYFEPEATFAFSCNENKHVIMEHILNNKIDKGAIFKTPMLFCRSDKMFGNLSSYCLSRKGEAVIQFIW